MNFEDLDKHLAVLSKYYRLLDESKTTEDLEILKTKVQKDDSLPDGWKQTFVNQIDKVLKNLKNEDT